VFGDASAVTPISGSHVFGVSVCSVFMPKKQYFGRCGFCEFEGKLSKEHIFSDWLGKFLPTDLQRTDTVIRRFAGEKPRIESKKKSGAVHTRKDANVCETCNSGWMSGIVDKAKPIEEKIMFGGGDVTLTPNEIESLRQKICLTAFTLYLVHTPDFRFFKQSDRQQFRQTLDPCAFAYIYVCMVKDIGLGVPTADTSTFLLHLDGPNAPPPSIHLKSIQYFFGRLGVYALFKTALFERTPFPIDSLPPALTKAGIQLLPDIVGHTLFERNTMPAYGLMFAANAFRNWVAKKTERRFSRQEAFGFATRSSAVTL
jgi:hypothetical protein